MPSDRRLNLNHLVDPRQRVMILIGIGLIVGCCALAAAYRQGVRGGEEPEFDQSSTMRAIEETHTAVDKYRAHMGRLPNTLAALYTPTDGWQRPLIYRRSGAGYVVLSYGRDGKPGGVGLDCDLSDGRTYPPQAAIPLWQFLTTDRGGSAIRWSLVAGFLAVVACGRALQPNERLTPAVLAAVSCTLVFSIFCGMVIVLLYVYPHH